VGKSARFSLLEGRQHPRQTAELYATAGYLCALLAWISCDLGQLQAADTHGRAAWLCAELTSHDDLRAWVLSTRSKIAFWDGRLRDAINLARRGAAFRPHGTAGIMLACQEADAWAALGAIDGARGALARAEAARDQMEGAGEVAGLFACSDFRRADYASSVPLRIRRPGDARPRRRQHSAAPGVRDGRAGAHRPSDRPPRAWTAGWCGSALSHHMKGRQCMTGERTADHWWWRPGWKHGRRFHTWHLTFDDAADVRRLARAGTGSPRSTGWISYPINGCT
jgi:hypothetical protein